MELIPIIEASLSIFTVFTAFFIILSYLLYKLRGKSNVKQPYLKEIAADNLISIMVEKSRIIENDEEKLKRLERFKVVNSVQAPTSTNQNPDEKINVLSTVTETYKTSNIIIKPHAVNDNLNIYNLYSNSSLRPMHKLQAQEQNTLKNI